MLGVLAEHVWCVVVLMRRRPARSTQSRSSAASDVYKRQPKSPKGDLDVVCVLPLNFEKGISRVFKSPSGDLGAKEL